jgi:hypothetical protein
MEFLYFFLGTGVGAAWACLYVVRRYDRFHNEQRATWSSIDELRESRHREETASLRGEHRDDLAAAAGKYESFLDAQASLVEKLVDRLCLREQLPTVFGDPLRDGANAAAGSVVEHSKRVAYASGLTHAAGPISRRRTAQEEQEGRADVRTSAEAPEVGAVEPTLSAEDEHNLMLALPEQNA